MRNLGRDASSPHANRKQQDFSFLLGELIGRRARVVKSSCKDLQGIEGIVADEGRNSFLFETSKGSKRIPKAGSTFQFPQLSPLEISGKLLICRPEDRTKKLAALVSKGRL